MHRLYCVYATEENSTRMQGAGRGSHNDQGYTCTAATPGQFIKRLGGPSPKDRMEDAFKKAAAQMPALLGEYKPRLLSLESSNAALLSASVIPALRTQAWRAGPDS